MQAIVHFRTRPFGAFRWTRGLTRGHWRVLVVRDPAGSRHIRSHNVVSVIYTGRDGLMGTTEKSRYYVGDDQLRASEVAEQFNLQGA